MKIALYIIGGIICLAIVAYGIHFKYKKGTNWKSKTIGDYIIIGGMFLAVMGFYVLNKIFV